MNGAYYKPETDMLILPGSLAVAWKQHFSTPDDTTLSFVVYYPEQDGNITTWHPQLERKTKFSARATVEQRRLGLEYIMRWLTTSWSTTHDITKMADRLSNISIAVVDRSSAKKLPFTGEL